jgi:CRISPR/Cas system endoribonuclease Cas6 (RAMP superfamily)
LSKDLQFSSTFFTFSPVVMKFPKKKSSLKHHHHHQAVEEETKEDRMADMDTEQDVEHASDRSY